MLIAKREAGVNQSPRAVLLNVLAGDGGRGHI